jgi:hypothetical protein
MTAFIYPGTRAHETLLESEPIIAAERAQKNRTPKTLPAKVTGDLTPTIKFQIRYKKPYVQRHYLNSRTKPTRTEATQEAYRTLGKLMQSVN